MVAYSKIPAECKLHVRPFEAHVPEEKLQQFRDLIRLAPIGAADFNNSHPTAGNQYGIRREWLQHAKKVWENAFDWRKVEDKINSYPNFTTSVVGREGEQIDVHFVALFSKREDALPLALYHGWPSSFADFFDILDLLKAKYTPAELPYHVIVPSLPGFAFSGTPPVDLDYEMQTAAHLLNNLMVGLGLSGYIAQGGDLGSGISREQAAGCEACKGFHLNMILLPPPPNFRELPLGDVEKRAMPNTMEFRKSGMAYALEHGTRGGTIGLALQSSPVALLCWIAEKMLAWSEEKPSLQRILETVSLYWLTDTFPRSLYPYRRFASGNEPKIEYIDKPLGYSFFPNTYLPCPVSWAKTTANLVHYRRHETGGHFAPWERPAELLEDIEEYIATAWLPRDRKRMKLTNGAPKANRVNGHGEIVNGVH